MRNKAISIAYKNIIKNALQYIYEGGNHESQKGIDILLSISKILGEYKVNRILELFAYNPDNDEYPEFMFIDDGLLIEISGPDEYVVDSSTSPIHYMNDELDEDELVNSIDEILFPSI